MERYGPETYGERIADVYDTWYGGHDPAYAVDPLSMVPTDAVDHLARLAADGPPGPVLELAVGTGRVALPLAARGVEVHGIDASAAMVERLRAKPGGDAIPVTVGDMADVPVATDTPFSLAFLVLNSLCHLLTQDDQVRCCTNVADRLAPGGRFVLELAVPDLGRFDRGQAVYTHQVALDQVRLVTARHSPAGQRVEGQHVLLTDGGVRLFPVAMRYVWPSELDLMARLAGLRLVERWGGWRHEPFDDTSTFHVSVYEKPAAP